MKLFFATFFLLISCFIFSQEKYSFVVSKDGKGDYTSIQNAIDNMKAFPPERITIFIKNGIYKEKIKLHEWNSNLTLLGESKDSTIITFTAASTPENTEFGFVFQGCKFTSAPNISKVFLGRPWRIYAKTAILNSTLGNHILPEGWFNWDKPEAEKTSFYAEFNNSGNGSDVKNRVKWSHQLTENEAKLYSKENVLKDSNHLFWFKNAENNN